jgi:putative toxin-antitoxin system antitoxin component (TIGR02293 family)
MKHEAMKALGTGLVALHVAARQPTPSPGQVIQAVSAGADFKELTALREELDLPMEQLAAKLGFSRATLHRRKASGRLTSDESDKIVRYARLLGQAARVFGGADNARQWLKAPQRGLAGAVPLDYAETETGAREVEKLLGRIDYGVYS